MATKWLLFAISGSLFIIVTFALASTPTFDEITTERFDDEIFTVAWVKIVTCTSNGIFSFNGHSHTEMYTLAQEAITIKIVPINSTSNPDYNEYSIIAKPYSNPVIALNNYKEVSYTINTSNSKLLGYADLSNWIGTANALSRLSNSCYGDDKSKASSLDDVIYQACGNGEGLHVWPLRHSCRWSYTDDAPAPDIEVYFGYPMPLNDTTHSLYGKQCVDLTSNNDIQYNTKLDECIQSCITNQNDCVMINYFNYFKTTDDSRCYMFNHICQIKEDMNANRSVLVYKMLENKCMTYPSDWTDSIGDTCGHYEAYHWCDKGSALQPEDAFDALMNSKFGITALEACCGCGGGIRTMDNVAMSYDYNWIHLVDDIVCTFEPSEWIDTPYRTWNGLVLYQLCTSLMDAIDCAFLIESQMDLSDMDSTYSIVLCDDKDSTYDEEDVYHFVMEYFVDNEEQNHGIYMNTLWFDIDSSYYSDYINITTVNYSQCKLDLLALYVDRMASQSNVSRYDINGIHPCFVFDTQDSAEDSIDIVSTATGKDEDPDEQISVFFLFSISVFSISVLLLCIFVLVLIHKRKQARQNKQEEGKKDEIEMRKPIPPTYASTLTLDNRCIVCCDNAANMFNDPCGHVTYCKKCSRTALNQNDKCPHCREQIQCKQIYNAGFSDA
eukprot:250120_1